MAEVARWPRLAGDDVARRHSPLATTGKREHDGPHRRAMAKEDAAARRRRAPAIRRRAVAVAGGEAATIPRRAARPHHRTRERVRARGAFARIAVSGGWQSETNGLRGARTAAPSPCCLGVPCVCRRVGAREGDATLHRLGGACLLSSTTLRWAHGRRGFLLLCFLPCNDTIVLELKRTRARITTIR